MNGILLRFLYRLLYGYESFLLGIPWVKLFSIFDIFFVEIAMIYRGDDERLMIENRWVKKIVR